MFLQSFQPNLEKTWKTTVLHENLEFCEILIQKKWHEISIVDVDYLQSNSLGLFVTTVSLDVLQNHFSLGVLIKSIYWSYL